jgi:photosystem II stability/assembly factor-like uncharacterized protein
MRTSSSRVTFLLAAAVVAFAAGTPHAQQIDPSIFSDLRWRSIGPPRSGYVSAPAGVPGDSNTYYVGLPEGGVWKTTNAGVTWKPIFDELHVASVGAVAVAPSNPNIVYVGTGNQSGWSFTIGKGVYKSTDAGRTWTNVGLAKSQYIGGLVVDPRNPDDVLVAVLGPRPAGAGRGAAAAMAAPVAEADAERGVYRTNDGGKTWTRVLQTDGSAGASDVYFDYQDPQVAYALVGGGFGAAPQTAAQTSAPGTGAYKSTDGGATWKAVSGSGLPNGARIQSFAVSSGTHGRRLYAVAVVGGGRGAGANRALYRSDDGGDTWTLGTRALASAGGKIYADPQNPDVMYLMGTSVYRSTDGGRHVASYWGAPSGADPRFLWIDPTNSKRMLAGVDQGASISVDGGESWTPYYGLVNGQFYRVATDYDVPYHVCGPQQDSGTACVASRSDFGEIRPYDWYPGGGFENGFLIADPSDTRYMYTQGWYHVLRRFDKRTGQVIVLYQPGADERFGGAPPLAFSPQDPHTLYMASERVRRSKDRGETWEVISPDLAAVSGNAAAAAVAAGGGGVGAPAAGGSIQTLALSSVSPDVIWVGTSTELIHVTRDGGKTWANVTPPNLPPAAINVIDASHADAGTAYAALLSRDGHPHFYRTSNYGQNWDEISSGLRDDGTARAIREDPKDPSLLYAGTVTGVYVSFDRGTHWQPLQLNLPTTVVSDITVKDSDLVISTYGRGFWILDDVSPLRQARAVLDAHAAPYFFKPEPASRTRWDNTQDTPVPPEMVVGENPPEGAILDYYLPKAASKVTLTISDPSGGVIREFTNVAPPADTTMPNVPEYWIMPPTVMPTSAGMHRVNWDLRYPDPPSLNYGYSGNALDYREYTLNWHAIPGKTYRNTVVGPMVLPGTYTAKLTVDGQSSSQPITVVQDPRISVPEADLRAQFHLQQRMVAGLDVTYRAITYVQQVREALADRLKRAGTSQAAQITARAQAIDAELAPLAASSGPLGLAHRDLGRRINDQLIGDARPTASVIAGVDAPCAAIDHALDALRTHVSGIGQLNEQLKAASLAPLPLWTPPVAPACGK